jgi:hypothetical protein
MKLNIRTEDVAIELELEPEEFTQIMHLKTACIENPDMYKQYLMNIAWLLKALEGTFKNAEKH